MIVVTPDAVHPSTAGSEAYGDWDSYRQAFLRAKPAGLAHVQLCWSRLRRLAPRVALKEGFATIFVRPGGAALLYRGMVLEPQIYILGSDWAADGTRSRPPASWGLVATTLPVHRDAGFRSP